MKTGFHWASIGLSAMILSACATVDDTTISLASDTYFNTDSAEILPAARSELVAVANRIKLNRLTINAIRVEGNTDSVGHPDYNLDLSKRRALSVVNELIGNGIPAQMLTAQGNGETKPVASNSTEAGRAANRRVDIIIKGRLLF